MKGGGDEGGGFQPASIWQPSVHYLPLYFPPLCPARRGREGLGGGVSHCEMGNCLQEVLLKEEEEGSDEDKKGS